MVLTVDIGNTNIKSGVFSENELTDFQSHSSLSDFFIHLEKYPPLKVAVCSVNPKTEELLVKGLTGRKITSYTITHKSGFNLIVEYKTPETLGIDRLCSAEGAFFLFKNSENYKSYNADTYILSIDFGTATTVNVVEYPGKFNGGLIAPGLEMMFESLWRKTAQLPRADVSEFTSAIGNDTNSSIAGGVVTSVVGMIEKTVNYLRQEKSAKEVVVYITGGNAKKIIPYLDFDFIYEKGLVLYGVNAIHNLNIKFL